MLKKVHKTVIAAVLSVVMAFSMLPAVFTPVMADDITQPAQEPAAVTQAVYSGENDTAGEITEGETKPAETTEGETAGEITAEKTETEIMAVDAAQAAAAARTQITGQFAAVDGYDIATVRYYLNANGVGAYGFAEISGNAQDGYSYSFEAPADNYSAVEGSNLNTVTNANVIAYYYSLSKWDGAVDVSWYNETDSDFYIYTPAQFAGVAAVVNGSVDGNIEPYQVKGARSHASDSSYNRGLPDYIESTYYEIADLIAGVKGPAYKGVMAHDFADRTIHIMADMDMGGVSGSEITMGAYDISTDQPDSNWNRNLHPEYPNWTPIGGEYLMDVTDSDSMIIAFFNGTIDGHGHNINNIYCYRWSYRTVGSTAYGYSQGVGLVGDMGTLYDDDRGKESEPEKLPALRNMGLSGFIYGRRMVGGFVGCIGGGSNAADGSSVTGGISLENLANHAYVYCTDSKGLGGIAGCSMSVGSIVNCYNDGYLEAQYAAPTGGIVGANEGMDIYCSYSRGTVYGMQERGRGIGGDSAGSNYTVASCYYLENSSNDTRYPGYYAYNLAPSVSVDVTEMSDARMKSQELINGLNVNGTAYVTGDQGYPVLYWEKNSGTGNLTIVKPQGGTVTAQATGNIENGTVVYLENSAETGWNFRNYLLNGEAMTGDYVTVNGNAAVSAFFESAKAGVLKIVPSTVADIKVTKNGTVIQNGEAVVVENYPVNEGDSIYEGDILIVEAKIKDGVVPSDPGYSYSYSVGLASPFTYSYQYTGGDNNETDLVSYTVDSRIKEDNVSLTLQVIAKTTPKLWKYQGVTDWYDENESEFILTTAEQLAGLELLVEQGNTFAGKTVKLGNDISLKNDDGSAGDRFWDGIGIGGSSSTVYFAGIFDGQGYSITNYKGSKTALFANVCGTTSVKAEVRNVNIYGSSSGQDASGIVSYAKYARIENCNAYCRIDASKGYCGGIVGFGQAGCEIKNCVNYGSITSNASKVGGIAGEIATSTSVIGCINRGDIESPLVGGNYIGGICGSQNGAITACANYGNVTAAGRGIGGLSGLLNTASSVMTDCMNVGNVTFKTGTNEYDCVGGLIGFASRYKIYNTYNYGKVENQSTIRHVGALFGREGAKSTSETTNVYFLESANEYVEDGIVFEDVSAGATYLSGVNKASAADFADASKVLAAINGNNSFVLSNMTYPELTAAATVHVHKGGIASCDSKAVCDECGLEYGEIDSSYHKESVLRNAVEPVWTYDGYSGDMICRACGEVTEVGHVIPADTTRTAITVNIMSGNNTVSSKTYTVAEFDDLKDTSPYLAYSYGGSYGEMLVTTQYVTLEKLAQDQEYEFADIKNVDVICVGSKDEYDADTLRECCYYYDADNQRFDAPASIAICYGCLTGTIDEVASEAKPSNSLRFGFGISEEQHEQQASLGGKRLVSPVNVLNFYIEETEEPKIEVVDSEGVTHVITETQIKAAASVTTTAEEPWTNSKGNTYVGTFYSLKNILESAGVSISEAHGISTVATDGFTNGFSEEEIDSVYIYDQGEVLKNGAAAGDAGTFGTALNKGAGNKWATNLAKVNIAADHVWFVKNGKCQHYCSICGGAEPSITFVDAQDNETAVYECEIKAAASVTATEEEPWTNSKGNTYVGTFYSLASILENAGVSISEADGISVEAADGFVSEYTLEEAQVLYIYDQGEVLKNGAAAGDAGTFGTAINGGAGNRWAKNASVITVVVTPEPTERFSDIADCGQAAKDAIIWAADKEIVNGYTGDKAGMFGPTDNCTRQQMMIMLWRAAGSPMPVSIDSANEFKDSGEFVYSGRLAIAWGVENAIVGGYTRADGKYFDPAGTVTRAQTVIMMWRMAGKPAPKSTSAAFADIADQSAGVKTAIYWAAENGITRGSVQQDGSVAFKPTDPCQRQHIAIFVSRLYPLLQN